MSNKPSLVSWTKNTAPALFTAKVLSLACDKLAPNWTYKKVENLFTTPKSQKINKNKIPHGIKPFRISTKEGALQCYQLGQGPTVVLVHGWGGGAHQFFPLMRGLSQCGFRAVTFDHYGHGHSDGVRASLLSFTAGVNAVIKVIKSQSPDEDMIAIVGHSMGCIAIANANKNLIKDISLLFIAPVFNFKKYFIRQVKLQGLHPGLSKQYISRFEHSYLSELDNMELNVKLVGYATDTVIVHDKEDKESGIIDSIKFCSTHPLTKLVIAKAGGHVRIINSEIVWQQLKSHLNYEDITSTYFH